jgi:hypothetical protein
LSVSESPGVAALAKALRDLQRQFGLSSVSATMLLNADSITLRVEGLHEPPLLSIENTRGDVHLVRPEFLR